MTSTAETTDRGSMLRLRVWGLTESDIERAIDRASRGGFRSTWKFTQIERLSGAQCPLNLNDPKAIADDRDSTWAYVVYPESGHG